MATRSLFRRATKLYTKRPWMASVFFLVIDERATWWSSLPSGNARWMYAVNDRVSIPHRFMHTQIVYHPPYPMY